MDSPNKLNYSANTKNYLRNNFNYNTNKIKGWGEWFPVRINHLFNGSFSLKYFVITHNKRLRINPV